MTVTDFDNRFDESQWNQIQGGRICLVAIQNGTSLQVLLNYLLLRQYLQFKLKFNVQVTVGRLNSAN